MPPPQSLQSKSVNPSNLLELQVLTQVVTQLQANKDVRGSIPYLAKIAQIVENQTLVKPTEKEGLDHYYQQLNQLNKVKADANAQLGNAYFQTQQFILCESVLLRSVKLWENLVQHTTENFNPQLKASYQQLKTCYESLGKTQLAQHMDIKLSKVS